jgi:hypothetical protein
VVIDPALVEHSRPDVCREAEMRGVVSVQMPDLSSGCLERELASAARVGCKYSIRRVRGRNLQDDRISAPPRPSLPLGCGALPCWLAGQGSWQSKTR